MLAKLDVVALLCTLSSLSIRGASSLPSSASLGTGDVADPPLPKLNHLRVVLVVDSAGEAGGCGEDGEGGERLLLVSTVSGVRAADEGSRELDRSMAEDDMVGTGCIGGETGGDIVRLRMLRGLV